MRRLLLVIATCAVGVSLGWFATDSLLRREWHDSEQEIAALDIRKPGQKFKSSEEDRTSVEPNAIQFEDMASSLGMDFVYFDGAFGDFHLFEAMGGGMAVSDFDRDGQLDVFFANGKAIDSKDKPSTSRSALFLRNRSAGSELNSFLEVGRVAGVGFDVYAQGAAAADFDNDGFDDLLVSGFGDLLLVRNQGDGTFKPQPLEVQAQYWTSAAWVDLDSDGDLDLYVCSYADIDRKDPPKCYRQTVRTHCPPQRFPAFPDGLFENLGDGRFRNANREAGAFEKTGRGLGVAASDFNGDGRPDLYVANDMSDAFLWINESESCIKLTNSARKLGVSLTADGSTMAGMGIAVGDYDCNGRMDICVTDFFESGISLFSNQGSAGFVPTGRQSRLTSASKSKLGFGCLFSDFDLDGLLDLIVANGHISDLRSLGIPHKMQTQVFRNLNGERFLEVTNGSGEYFKKLVLGRGAALGDFDDNGRPDVVLSNILDSASLLVNRTATNGHWLGFELVGVRSNRSARNVRVDVHTDKGVRKFETVSGSGYLSSSDHRLLVGLGTDAVKVERVIIRWSCGKTQEINAPELDKYYFIRESTSD